MTRTPGCWWRQTPDPLRAPRRRLARLQVLEERVLLSSSGSSNSIIAIPIPPLLAVGLLFGKVEARSVIVHQPAGAVLADPAVPGSRSGAYCWLPESPVQSTSY